MLKFSKANTKLKKLYEVAEVKAHLKGRKIYSLDLPAGKSCPSSLLCNSKAVLHNGKLKVVDGPSCQFRCYAASQEALFKHVFENRKYNFDLVKPLNKQQIRDLILISLPRDAGLIRIHSSGDFWSKKYFEAWLQVVEKLPDIWFYAYTKSLNYWVSNKSKVDSLTNLIMTASYGGKLDNLIKEHNLKYSKVVYSEDEARKLKLPIDFDDSYACCPSKKFVNSALLLHGAQPANSLASKALQKIKLLKEN